MEKIIGKHLFQFKELDIRSLNKIIENILFSLNDLHIRKVNKSDKTEIKDVYINKT